MEVLLDLQDRREIPELLVQVAEPQAQQEPLAMMEQPEPQVQTAIQVLPELMAQQARRETPELQAITELQVFKETQAQQDLPALRAMMAHLELQVRQEPQA